MFSMLSSANSLTDPISDPYTSADNSRIDQPSSPQQQRSHWLPFHLPNWRRQNRSNASIAPADDDTTTIDEIQDQLESNSAFDESPSGFAKKLKTSTLPPSTHHHRQHKYTTSTTPKLPSTSPLSKARYVTSKVVNEVNTTTDAYVHTYWYIFKTFNNPTIMLEYSEFNVKQRSIVMVILVALFFTASLRVAIVAPFVLDHHHPRYEIVYILGNCSWIMNCIDTIMSWLLVYRQTKQCRTSKHSIPTWIRNHTPSIQYYLLITLSFGYAFRLLSRVICGRCDENTTILTEWNCNRYHDVNALPIDTVMAMMLTPVAYPAIFKESRMDIVLFAFFLSIAAMLAATAIIGSTDPLFYITLYACLFTFFAYDSTRQSLKNFISHKQLQLVLEENQRMTLQAEIEMRHIIANVAHDFKTVSLPFYCFFLWVNDCGPSFFFYSHYHHS